MIPVFLISVTNYSDKVTDNQAQAIVSAIGKQLAYHVVPAWGKTPALEYVPKGGKGNGVPFSILDDSDMPDALGYHDIGDDGVPFIKIFTKPVQESGGQILIGNGSLSTVASHEILELVGDPSANFWAEYNGKDYALELCDAVENDCYLIDGVSVSNFVYPSFFSPKAQKNDALDFMGLVTRPFETRPGGYQIVRHSGKAFSGWTTDANNKLALYKNNHVITAEFSDSYSAEKREVKLNNIRRRYR